MVLGHHDKIINNENAREGFKTRPLCQEKNGQLVCPADTGAAAGVLVLAKLSARLCSFLERWPIGRAKFRLGTAPWSLNGIMV